MERTLFSPDLAKSIGLDEHRFPENNNEADIVEAALSKELEKLSLDEHEQILFQVHGFHSTKSEGDDAFFESKLRDLSKEIDSIKNKTAYEKARSFNPSYTDNRTFQLAFLRCSCCDAKQAADMLVQHFEIKSQLFGDGAILGRDIRYSDLTERACGLLENGNLQILGTRDASGRVVWCARPVSEMRTSEGPTLVDDWNRATWYLSMVLIRGDDLQSEVVFVDYNYEGWIEDLSILRRYFAVRSVLPLRMAAAHYCYTDPKLKPYVAGLLLFLQKKARVRMRTHLGSHDEIAFNLQTFGIPIEHCPMNRDGTWSTTEAREWLETQRVREADHDTLTVSVPRRFDVLFGMRKCHREHTGNLRLLHLCEMNFEEYEEGNKNRKADIAERLCSIIRESRGRFLKRSESGWVEVEDEVARAKVAHFFRHMRSKKTKPTSC